jgi:hypothetical protein
MPCRRPLISLRLAPTPTFLSLLTPCPWPPSPHCACLSSTPQLTASPSFCLSPSCVSSLAQCLDYLPGAFAPVRLPVGPVPGVPAPSPHPPPLLRLPPVFQYIVSATRSCATFLSIPIIQFPSSNHYPPCNTESNNVHSALFPTPLIDHAFTPPCPQSLTVYPRYPDLCSRSRRDLPRKASHISPSPKFHPPCLPTKLLLSLYSRNPIFRRISSLFLTYLTYLCSSSYLITSSFPSPPTF